MLSSDLGPFVRRELACREQGEVCAINWDFWSSAQDGEVDRRTLRVSVLATSDTVASVRLTYVFSLGPGYKAKTLSARVALRRESAGCWVVDDILRDRGSFKALLKRAHPPRR